MLHDPILDTNISLFVYNQNYKQDHQIALDNVIHVIYEGTNISEAWLIHENTVVTKYINMGTARISSKRVGETENSPRKLRLGQSTLL